MLCICQAYNNKEFTYLLTYLLTAVTVPRLATFRIVGYMACTMQQCETKLNK